jgi:hypothetical protein
MAFIPWDAAAGDPATIVLPVAAMVAIAPPDDSVDSNRVTVMGTGTVSSLGPGPIDPDSGLAWEVTKHVIWEPTSSAAPIILQHNPPYLNLLGGVTRTITVKLIGSYHCDENGYWTEESVTDTTQAGGGGGAGPVGPPGPPGPTAVSTDTPNMARLGSDHLLFVPDAVSDGIAHGRLNAAWVGVPVTPLDGGNF